MKHIFFSLLFDMEAIEFTASKRHRRKKLSRFFHVPRASFLTHRSRGVGNIGQLWLLVLENLLSQYRNLKTEKRRTSKLDEFDTSDKNHNKRHSSLCCRKRQPSWVGDDSKEHRNCTKKVFLPRRIDADIVSLSYLAPDERRHRRPFLQDLMTSHQGLRLGHFSKFSENRLGSSWFFTQ